MKLTCLLTSLTLLFLTACVVDENRETATNATLNRTLIHATPIPLTEVDFDPSMIKRDDSENATQRRGITDCHCYLKVNSTTNVEDGHLWGLSDITAGQSNPYELFEGSNGTWVQNTMQMPLPTPYLELDSPSDGDHTLSLFDFNFPLTAGLNVSIVCVDESGGGFALANAYNFDLNFQDGFVTPFGTSEFDIYLSCNPNDGGNSGS